MEEYNMKLSRDNKQKIIDEIKFALEQMKQNEDLDEKLYYFSAVYGVLPRIFNIEFNEDLLFIHFVINSTYNNIKGRIKNPDKVIKIPDDLGEKLVHTTEELLTDLKEDKNLYNVLKRFTVLGYVTTGNGYYLYKKGYLKI